MEDLFKKISHYQLFNFLLSGAVLVAALARTTNINLSSSDVVLSFFLYYFIGLVTSRVGSLLIEPVLKSLRIIKFMPYDDYVKAAKTDAKIDVLSQENNTYRTLVATSLIYLVIYLVNKHAQQFIASKRPYIVIAVVVVLIVLFAYAYHKQTEYISKRVKQALQR